MANQRKSEARQKRITQYGQGSRKVAKTWGVWWRAMNTPLGADGPDLTPPQMQGTKIHTEKKEKKEA